MNRLYRLTCLVALTSLCFAGCNFIDGPDGGGGGGGGVLLSFTQGFTYIRSDDRNVYLVDKSDYLTVGRLTVNGDNRHPALSRDGRRVVFVHNLAGVSELSTVATTGSSQVSVLKSSDTSLRNFRYPVFSPDGQKVVFVFDKGASSQLGRINVDGSGFQEVTSGPLSYGAPSFFADGRSVLVPAGSSAASLTQLEQVTLDTGLSLSVRSSLGNEALQVANRAALSPDGTKVAFDGRVSTGATRIFVMDLGTKNVTKLSEHPGDAQANDAFPSWMSNAEVAFQSDAGGADQVYSLRVATAVAGAGSLVLPTALEPFYGPLL